MGGGTTKVGDLFGTGRKRGSSSRSADQLEYRRNSGDIRPFFALRRFPDRRRDGQQRRLGLSSLQYIPFLRDIGRHFFDPIEMLTMDSVKLRLEREQPLTFLEFNYMIFAGLRLSWTLNKRLQLHIADGRLGSVGAISCRGLSSDAAVREQDCSDSHSHAHHHVPPAPKTGQDRERRACG